MQSPIDRFMDFGHWDADGKKFLGGEYTVRTRRNRRPFHEILLAFEKGKRLGRDPAFLDHFDNFAGENGTGVRDMIGSVGNLFLPA